MSGVSIQIDIDDRQIQAALSKLIALGQNLSPVMQAIAFDGEKSTKDRFRDSKAPDGSTWKPNVRGNKTLILTSELVNSITRHSGADFAEWGSNVIYAAIHQFGGVIRAKNKPYLVFKVPGGRLRRVKQVTMPARPYLGLNAEDEENILDIINRNLQQAVFG